MSARTASSPGSGTSTKLPPRGRRGKRSKPAIGDDDFDVESQSRSTFSFEEDQTPVFQEHVGVAMDERTADQWKLLAGSEAIPLLGGRHHHPILAASRCVLERDACTEALRNQDAIVVDIGGAPHRTFAKLGDRGRYLCPQLQRGDHNRFRNVPQGARQYVCRHRFEECHCYDGQRKVLLFVHSAYYFDYAMLWSMIRQEDVVDALVVEHRFDDGFGGFLDEAAYSLDGVTVTMSVKGNVEPYVHGLTPWLVGWRGPNGEAFEVSTLRVIGDFTYLGRIEAVVKTGPSPTLQFDDVIAGAHKMGPVQFSESIRNAVADNAKFQSVKLDLFEIEAWGPVLFTTGVYAGRRVRVTVPVNAINRVSSIALNRTRDANLLQEVSHSLKNQFQRSRLPPGKFTEALTVAIAMGLVTNLQNETSVLYTVREKFGWLISLHAALINGGRFIVLSWRWLIFGGGLVLIAFVLSETFDDHTDERIFIALGFVVGIASLWLCGFCCLGVLRMHRSRQLATWTAQFHDDDAPRVPLLGNSVVFEDRTHLLLGTRHVRQLPPVIEGQVRLEATRESANPPVRQIISGLVVDGAIPNVLEPTQAAELSAVTNRILTPRANPKEDALVHYRNAFHHPVFTAVKATLNTSKVGFEMWAKGLAGKYPVRYIEKMREAWEFFQGTEPPPVSARGFLKLELSAAAVTLEGQKATKPRLIQPPEDVDKAITGPISSQMFAACVDAWNGTTSRVMYCAKWTSDQVGAAVDGYIERAGGEGHVVGWSVDMATYDATLCLLLQLPALQEFYVSGLGMPPWLVNWYTRVRTRGRTPNGVCYIPERTFGPFLSEDEAKEFANVFLKYKFRVLISSTDIHDVEGQDLVWLVKVEDFQMASGRSDTNLTDTVILVATFVAILGDMDFLLLVCGDDGFLLLRVGDAPVIDRIKAFQLDLGLKPEGVVSTRRSDWEFCSRLFWHGRNPKTGVVQTVLGAKPIRGITRMGSKTTLPGAENAAAAALSVRLSDGHVPFLRVFADRTKELCTKLRLRPHGRPEWTSMRSSMRFECVPQNYTITQERYNLGETHEVEFTHLLSQVHEVPATVNWPSLWGSLTRDEA